jgi:hypothetical protein
LKFAIKKNCDAKSINCTTATIYVKPIGTRHRKARHRSFTAAIMPRIMRIVCFATSQKPPLLNHNYQDYTIYFDCPVALASLVRAGPQVLFWEDKIQPTQKFQTNKIIMQLTHQHKVTWMQVRISLFTMHGHTVSLTLIG